MPIFDWNQILGNAHPDWQATKGRTVKIALIDSGLERLHPAFGQLNHNLPMPHYFWVAHPDYDPHRPLPHPDDEVADAMPFGEAHGTACAGVLVAQPETPLEGLQGLAPQAELYCLKIATPDALQIKPSAFDVLKAFDLARRLDVDIISCSVLPRLWELLPEGDKQRIFEGLTERKILLFTALDNRTRLKNLNALMFPCDQPGAIVCGVAPRALLMTMLPGETFDPRIAFLHPDVPVMRCSAISYRTDPCSSSLATAGMAGMAALRIAQWKQAEGDNYRRRPREVVLDELRQVAQPFSKAAMLAAKKPQFFFPVHP